MLKLFSRRGHNDDRASSAPVAPSALPTSLPPALPGSSGIAPLSEAASDTLPPPPPDSSPPNGGGNNNSHGHPGLNDLTLGDITRGMRHATTSANQMLAQQYTALLDQFFDADKAGALVAWEVELTLGSQYRLALPLVSLAMPCDLALDEMAMNVTIRNDIAETLPVYGAATNGVGRLCVSLTSHSKRDIDHDSEHIDIETRFTALQVPKAVVRVIDEYTNRLVPRPVQLNAEVPDGHVSPSISQEKSNEH